MLVGLKSKERTRQKLKQLTRSEAQKDRSSKKNESNSLG